MSFASKKVEFKVRVEVLFDISQLVVPIYFQLIPKLVTLDTSSSKSFLMKNNATTTQSSFTQQKMVHQRIQNLIQHKN